MLLARLHIGDNSRSDIAAGAISQHTPMMQRRVLLLARKLRLHLAQLRKRRSKGKVCAVFEFSKLRAALNKTFEPGNAALEYNGIVLVERLG
ncbi:MAG TPA: hypothetical protein VFG44_04450 [Burkholderiales bacterium]|nr:hypothetical protein [Burkholderiales bacterium]